MDDQEAITMNVDAQFPQAPAAALANRPQPTQAGQTTARPVDKANKDASTDNRTGPDARQTEAQKTAARPEQAHEKRVTTGNTDQERGSRSPAGTFQANSRDSEPVGELLDVLA
ncbi:MAG TPA: hypothetical protein ENK49_11505 [Gammaproteobacteria bacterium]|nr:hypothetical protein [Gammaproteobacteria bacterium]